MPVSNYVAFDLETTGLSPDQDEILEIALVRFENGEPIERWSTLLKPGKQVPLKTLRLTGISAMDLEVSPAFGEEISDAIENFRGSLPLVGHNSGFDTAFLQKIIPGFPGVNVYDTLELARIVFPGFKSYKLTDLARTLGVTVSEAHRAYDDAQVSGGIFRLIQEAADKIPAVTKGRIRSIMGNDWEADHLFAPSQENLPAQPGLFDWVPPQLEDIRPLPQEPDAGLRNRIMDLLERPGRDLVLADIAGTSEALDTVVSCALDYSRTHDARILLIGFPDVYLGQEIGAAREPSDYLCLAKFHSAMNLAQEGGYGTKELSDRRFLASLARWVDITDTGSFSDIQITGSLDLAKDLSCPADVSCRQSCPLADACFAQMAEKAQRPVSLARHDRCMSIVGRWDRVVIWNFHEIARAWQWREAKLDPTGLQSILEQEGVLESVPSLARLSKHARGAMGRYGTVADSSLQDLLAELLLELKGTAQGSKNQALERAAASLGHLLDPAEGTVMLVEEGYGEKGRRPMLARRALWPGSRILSHVGQNLGPAILMSPLSGTLRCSAGLQRFFGIEESTLKDNLRHEAETENVLLVLVDEFPVPGSSQYPSYVSGILSNLIPGHRTGTQVLFSSRALLKAVYELCSKDLEAGGVAVYGAGIDGGRKVVEHLLDEDSTVFSTGGFPAYGDPVPSCLVIPKVPFLPPNPLDDLRRREFRGSGVDPFAEVNVGHAALAIRAHVERQIDSGRKCAVVLCDPKALPGRSGWAASFLEHFADLPRATCSAPEAIRRIAQWTSGENTGK